ncbi:2TM domain-containing protein [Ichthyenterobacterium sp. W332]|uniref:2TM domain-containing protein n=1 Tax=Microcosmobacter mediterraneus TaxID=3075607 RepID=A0ABU2YM03_9FLAO|nr:2TM domain-containing protein [Ichthyenterobacterium sp. W332]MDT0559156.1 2TM domain-containing protein [Ichthyenterobacterium sp. W332]
MDNYSIEPYSDDENRSQRQFEKEEAYLRAKKKLDKIIGFYWHLAVYIVINIFLILLIGFNSGEGFRGFGPYATAVFWGIGLLFHFLGVFGPGFIFGKNWEERKIQEFIEKDQEEFRRFE